MSEVNFSNAEVRTRSLFCEFTSEERASKGDLLADKRIRMDELKDEVAALNKEKGDLDKEILSISKLLKHGGEDRFVKCLIAYNYPNDGDKTIKRTDTGEEWVETMSDGDYKLFNEDEHEAPKILQLPPASIESVFGLNPADFDHFIGNTVEDFAEHGIELSESDIRKFGRKLYVKASFQDITQLTNKPYQGKFNSDVSDVFWYMFEPIVNIDEIEEADYEEESSDPTTGEMTIDDESELSEEIEESPDHSIEEAEEAFEEEAKEQ